MNGEGGERDNTQTGEARMSWSWGWRRPAALFSEYTRFQTHYERQGGGGRRAGPERGVNL